MDRRLRSAVGRIAEARELCFQITYDIRGFGEQALVKTATRLTEMWCAGRTGPPSTIVHEALVQAAAEKASEVFRGLKQLAHELRETLESTAQALRFAESPGGRPRLRHQ